jgi:DNA-binding CsgD family transcriptional regulator
MGRIAPLETTVVAVLSAIAVLGAGGADARTVSAVADVPDIQNALDVLVAERLIVIDRAQVSPRIGSSTASCKRRCMTTSRVTREQMHAAAAARLGSHEERLRHRVAAAQKADGGLASDLARFADVLHERSQFREAARLRRQAAALSGDADQAAAHLLEADVELVLALDFDAVSVNDTAVVLDASDRFIVGIRLAAERFVAASDVLSTLTDSELDALTAVNAYRARVLQAWSLVRWPVATTPCMTSPSQGRARRRTLRCVGMRPWRRVRQPAHCTERAAHVYSGSALDRSRAVGFDTARHRVAGLAGCGHGMTGMPNEAIGDLRLLTTRFSQGQLDFSDGMFHGLQGFAHFVNGEWPRAAMMIGLSRAGRLRDAAPLVASIEPLAGVVAGDAERTRAALEVGRRIRIDGPQPAAVHAGDIVDVFALSFLGTDLERQNWLEGRTRDLGSPDVWIDEQVPHLWYVAQAIGAQWAGSTGGTAVGAAPAHGGSAAVVGPRRRMARKPGRAVTGCHRSPAAGGECRHPAASGREHSVLFDAAERVPHDPRVQAAAFALRGLGAEALAARLPGLSAGGAGVPSVLAGLSEREREVVTLVLEGLSYEQVAKELFITRSTVSFHLSRIYAKTGTTSRHEFVAAVGVQMRRALERVRTVHFAQSGFFALA